MANCFGDFCGYKACRCDTIQPDRKKEKSMSSIEHTRGDITLKRGETGWHFTVKNQDVPVKQQGILITKKSAVEDLKAIIGQVEAAARTLGHDDE